MNNFFPVVEDMLYLGNYANAFPKAKRHSFTTIAHSQATYTYNKNIASSPVEKELREFILGLAKAHQLEIFSKSEELPVNYSISYQHDNFTLSKSDPLDLLRMCLVIRCRNYHRLKMGKYTYYPKIGDLYIYNGNMNYQLTNASSSLFVTVNLLISRTSALASFRKNLVPIQQVHVSPTQDWTKISRQIESPYPEQFKFSYYS